MSIYTLPPPATQLSSSLNTSSCSKSSFKECNQSRIFITQALYTGLMDAISFTSMDTYRNCQTHGKMQCDIKSITLLPLSNVQKVFYAHKLASVFLSKPVRSAVLALVIFADATKISCLHGSHSCQFTIFTIYNSSDRATNQLLLVNLDVCTSQSLANVDLPIC